MPTARIDKPLTPKQALFVEFIAQGKSQTDALLAAGYESSDPATLAHHTAQKPHIAAAIARTRERKTVTQAWTVDWWRSELGSCLRDANEASDLPSRLRALELAGKHLGALEPTAPVSPAASAIILYLQQNQPPAIELPQT